MVKKKRDEIYQRHMGTFLFLRIFYLIIRGIQIDLLLFHFSQISTTNPVESWHRKLKTGVKADMHRNYLIPSSNAPPIG
jgi:hypothetical protein